MTLVEGGGGGGGGRGSGSESALAAAGIAKVGVKSRPASAAPTI